MADSKSELSARRQRAVERSARFTRSVDEPATSAERIDLLVELTRASWAISGRPWPNLARDHWPIEIRRLEDER